MIINNFLRLFILVFFVGTAYAEEQKQDLSVFVESVKNGSAVILATGSSTEMKRIAYVGVSLGYINSTTTIQYNDRKTIYPIYIFFGLKAPWHVSPYIEGGVDLLDLILDDLFSTEEKDSGVGVDYFLSGGVKYSFENNVTLSLYAKKYVFKFEDKFTNTQTSANPESIGIGVTFHF